MKTGRRTIVPGDEYNALFAKAQGQNINIKQYAHLSDTLELMKKVIVDLSADTKALANMLKKTDAYRTCESVWSFCFRHLQYRRDAEGIEQVRRPIRAWQDRKKGVDCDCMTVFIGSILYNLRIPFVIRLTRYVANEFEHVYPVALIGNHEVIMDCVVHRFNYQVPYKSKKDITMKLQFLNGIDDEDDDDEEFDDYDDLGDIDLPEDAQALLWMDEDLEGLAGKAKRQEKKEARQEKRADKKEVRQEKKADRKEDRAEKKASKPPLKQRVGNVLHAVNKVNPGAALLRAGVLASMKLNIGNVAGKLRFSYWSDAQAAANNMDMAKFALLKTIRVKLENIFHGAGGEPKNLKKSILEGNGNKDKRVSLNGLGAIVSPVHDYLPLHTIVGGEIYADEFADVTTVNGLGEPVSATAAIAAASGVIGTIAALIKKIGELFKKGTPQAEKEAIQANTAAEDEKTRKFSLSNLAQKFAPMAAQLKQEAAAQTVEDLSVPQTDNTDNAAAEVPIPASAPSDHANVLDDYAPIDTGSGSSDLLPATTAADDEDEDESVPATTASGDEVDPTKQELEAFTTPSSSIIPVSKSTSTGDSSEKSSDSGGAMQWVKDHPMLTLLGLVTVAAGAIAIIKAVKKPKANSSAKPVNGLDGLDGRPKPRRRRSRTKSKSTTRRGSTTPAARRKSPSKRIGGKFRKVELK